MTFDDIDNADMLLIEQISARAYVLLSHYGKRPHRLAILMDLATAHAAHPLRLTDMLKADDFNLIHDIVGLDNHLDRSTGKLLDCFVPRFAECGR